MGKHLDNRVNLGYPAHEGVKRGIADLGPGVDGDMAFRQKRDARDPLR